MASRIVHADAPTSTGPSGLPIRHLVDAGVGATALFVGEQTVGPGQRVLRHRHPVEEVLTFLAGAGEATLDGERVPIGPGVTLFVPAGVVHGFRPTGPDPLRVLVVFPGPRFAETTLVEESGVGESGS